MPKLSKHPRFRTYVKKGANGQRWVSYAYDMRGTGKPDIALGTDYAEAMRRWAEIHHDAPRVAGTLEEAFRAWEERALPGYTSAETRKGFAKNLRTLRPFFGPHPWEAVTMPIVVGYLRKRTGKTQANREASLLRLIWNWARLEGITALPWPGTGLEKSRWKNREGRRDVEVSDEVFEAVYRHADPCLRAAMDIASATGLRVTDVLGLRLSDVRGGLLRVSAGKTGKAADFEVAGSVLARVLDERKAMRGPEHLFLLAAGRKPVTYRMLNDRFVKARSEAAKELPECAGLWLRDMRKRAAQISASLQQASELLQHDSTSTTRAHYRTVQKLKPVR